jgi:phosphopantothenate-cysteine ligase
MKILITSGGTKIPLDLVRHIGNMSNGTLGSRMAKELLEKGHEVLFFRAEKSKSPMSMNVDFNDEYEIPQIQDWTDLRDFYENHKDKYTEFWYKTFEDYQEGLETIIKEYKPDMVILAAAVSDYAPETVVKGKIRSKGDLTIQLKPLPKVISNVREWAGDKAKIVGFKLLVDVEEKELLDAAFDSLNKNKLDLVCANDLRTILNGSHKLWLCKAGMCCDYEHTELTDAILSWTKE